MAGIDKTYTSSYKEYKEFKDWADLQYVTFFDESKLRIGDWVWEYIEEDFAYGEIPIMNTPAWIDIYLIQNCKSDFVLSRMKSVHKEKSYLEFQNVKLSAKPPQEFKQNRKIVITKNERTRFPIHSKPYGGKMTWWLQCEDVYWGYNDVTRIWANDEMYYPTR
ncbi:MAG: hypothetical protein GY775_16615, partial [Candidatus Scalindua sp.]|nr:hypothetical protein [Candidatus Scalindua sp.]